MIAAGLDLRPLRFGAGAVAGTVRAAESLNLATQRASPLDLEVSGDLATMEPGSTRYVTREQLLAMPQSVFTVIGDSNFTGPTQISGVTLSELARQLASAPDSDLIVAVCTDQYHANYPRSYVTAHHPVLVLKINGKDPAEWPKDAEGHGSDMGPYLISHPNFTSGGKNLAHPDEPQIPWGVVKIVFRDEKVVFGAIAPRGPLASDVTVQQGYGIARQNCFRCHNIGAEGGQKAGRPWLVLSAWATSSPDAFAAYVRNPKSKNPNSQMPGNPSYDDATMKALTAYFQTLIDQEKQ
jgi:mono/diheme cytochrome c family protein